MPNFALDLFKVTSDQYTLIHIILPLYALLLYDCESCKLCVKQASRLHGLLYSYRKDDQGKNAQSVRALCMSYIYSARSEQRGAMVANPRKAK